MLRLVVMIRTHVMLDGLQDPAMAQALSARWVEAGFENGVDVAGQCAWLSPPGIPAPGSSGITDAGAQATGSGGEAVMTESAMDRAAGVARGFGLEVRDRVGSVFEAANDVEALRGRLVYEYKSRFATLLVFGLPAWVLHGVGPMLAGGGHDARSMLYPWLFELLLVGWACIAAGWPILWQGGLSAIHGRATGDLLTTLIVVGAWIGSAIGVIQIVFGREPWFVGAAGGGGPCFHAAIAAIGLAVLGRWLAHRFGRALVGRADWMLVGHRRLMAAWMVLGLVIAVVLGWRWGLAVGLLLPPVVSLGAINPWSPGWSAVLPVLGFAGVFLLGPGAFGVALDGVEIETAFGFGLLMVGVFVWGWQGLSSSLAVGMDS